MAERATPPALVATLDQGALEAWGRGIGEAAVAGRLRLPLVVALRGPLGAGKSVLARAVARGAGVMSPMPSPTYNLLFSYDGAAGVRVHHLDLYRLEDQDDVWELGWEELGEGREIVLIEWPERAESLLPGDRWEVELDFIQGNSNSNSISKSGASMGTERRLTVRRVGIVPEVPAPDVPAP